MGATVSVYRLKRYLEKGGDPNAYDELGLSLLYIHLRNPKAVELLLNHGADPNKFVLYQNKVPLRHCLYMGYYESAVLLIEHGADLNDSRFSALHNIMRHPQLIPLLVKKGADINIISGSFVTTPIGHAVSLFILMVVNHVVPKLRDDLLCYIRTIMKYRPKVDDYSREFIKYHLPDVFSKWIRGKWVFIRCAVKFLGLHQRAVVTANHPLRKQARGEFKDGTLECY
jgi:hypothetical protein